MKTLLHPATKAPALADLGLLVARVALGVILLAHGWQKFNEWTIDGTVAGFTDMGIPLPDITAPAVAVAELVGGGMLILGLLTPIVAAINAVSMVGAFFLVHLENGLFIGDNGYELVLAIFAGLIVLVVSGAGKFSVDGLIARRR